jgi:nitrite reductase/ring-hydroxylating ferredoxin subunit
VTEGGPEEHRLCRLDEIPDGGARSFWFGGDTERWGVFLLRRGSEIRCFVNSCPHLGTPLDLVPDRFLDTTGELIVCATHGARFRRSDGYCVAGPCQGKRLQSIALIRVGQQLWIAISAP